VPEKDGGFCTYSLFLKSFLSIKSISKYKFLNGNEIYFASLYETQPLRCFREQVVWRQGLLNFTVEKTMFNDKHFRELAAFYIPNWVKNLFSKNLIPHSEESSQSNSQESSDSDLPGIYK
jgi:hypothetical protein